jgi:hypothetical protein
MALRSLLHRAVYAQAFRPAHAWCLHREGGRPRHDIRGGSGRTHPRGLQNTTSPPISVPGWKPHADSDVAPWCAQLGDDLASQLAAFHSLRASPPADDEAAFALAKAAFAGLPNPVMMHGAALLPPPPPCSGGLAAEGPPRGGYGGGGGGSGGGGGGGAGHRGAAAGAPSGKFASGGADAPAHHHHVVRLSLLATGLSCHCLPGARARRCKRPGAPRPPPPPLPRHQRISLAAQRRGLSRRARRPCLPLAPSDLCAAAHSPLHTQRWRHCAQARARIRRARPLSCLPPPPGARWGPPQRREPSRASGVERAGRRGAGRRGLAGAPGHRAHVQP